MAKKKKVVEINRNKYNQIRKMDHNTMEEYINSIFEMGMKAAAPSFDTALPWRQSARSRALAR